MLKYAILFVSLLVSFTGFSQRPNVIFILADDIGYSDIGAYYKKLSDGQEPLVVTPNLDKLAEEGMMFMDCHTPASLCAPNRYCCQTGNYNIRGRKPSGVWGAYETSNILPDQKPIAKTMKEAGYCTAFFGKWHIGAEWYDTQGNIVSKGFNDESIDFEKGIAKGGPQSQGYDYSFNLPAGIQASPYAYFENGTWAPISTQSTIVSWERGEKNGNSRIGKAGRGDSEWNSSLVGPKLAEKAVAFIDDHLENNNDKPFFMFYASQAVHGPHTPPVKFGETNVEGATGISAHADLIFELDLQVGAIVKKLEEEGIKDNTLIIFTSDNGGLDVKASRDGGHFSNYSLSRYKGYIEEGGHRVPFIASWKGVIEPGNTSDQIIGVQDWVGTMYDLVGVSMNEGDALDAVSILPILAGKQQEEDPIREFLLYYCDKDNKKEQGIRMGDWVLIITKGEISGLYNLTNDRLQQDNRINEPEQAGRIAEMLATFTKATENKRTTPVVDYSDVKNRTIQGAIGLEVKDINKGNQDKLHTFPNPLSSGDYLTISFENSSENIESVDLLNLNGRVILSTASKLVKANDLASGVYMLRVKSTMGHLYSRKLLVQ